MSHYDGSHDYAHIERVLGLARSIAGSPAKAGPSYNPTVVTLAALLHDVGDKKYLKPGQDSTTLVQHVLLDLGASAALAEKIQTIVTAVSYSGEMKDPARVRAVIEQFPELAVVQDADRLDAIGAVGIGRTFTFGGAMGGAAAGKARGRGMEETIEHFTDKLEKLEGLMKTQAGREMARVRTERLRLFREWWDDEQLVAGDGLRRES